MPYEEWEPPSQMERVDALLERPLPNSPDAERTILGAVLLDNERIAQASELLVPEDFYVPSHRRIFTVMVSLFLMGSEIDSILIGEMLKQDHALESVGGISFITNLSYGVPHFANLEHYIRIVKDKSLLRQGVKVANRFMAACLEEEDLPEVIIEQGTQEMFQLTASTVMTSSLEPLALITSRSIAKAELIQQTGTVVTGLSSGYPDLDALTLGWQRTDLIIVAGRPSMGKTTFGLALGQNAALRAGARVLVFSLEMSKEQVGNRALSSESRVDGTRLRAGFMSGEEWDAVHAVQDEFSSARFYVDDTPGLTSLQVRSKAMRKAAEIGQLDLIIIDYLQLMSGSAKRSESRQQDVSDISRALKALAKELNVPVVALSQLNRGPENRPNHRPNLADLRESGAIEQDADIVAFVYRDKVYKYMNAQLHSSSDGGDSGNGEDNTAEIILAKNRNGATGTAYLYFDGPTTRFESLQQEG